MDGNDATKVISCTTETDMNNIMRAIGAGANEYVMKPLMPISSKANWNKSASCNFLLSKGFLCADKTFFLLMILSFASDVQGHYG